MPFAADDGNAGGIAVFVYIKAERAGLADSESQIGRIDFIDVAFANFFDAEVDGTLGETHLRDALV